MSKLRTAGVLTDNIDKDEIAVQPRYQHVASDRPFVIDFRTTSIADSMGEFSHDLQLSLEAINFGAGSKYQMSEDYIFKLMCNSTQHRHILLTSTKGHEAIAIVESVFLSNYVQTKVSSNLPQNIFHKTYLLEDFVKLVENGDMTYIGK